MNHLVVFAHPNPKSFGKGIVDKIEEISKEKGDEIMIRDLYDIGFNPILKPTDIVAFKEGNVPEDIKTEQEYVRIADIISFVYPVWWSGLPAMLKGYVDRVFSYGFAYEYTDEGPRGLLTEKRGLLFCTTGTSSEDYAKSGMHDSMRQVSDQGIFKFCGIDVTNHAFFGAVPYVPDEIRYNYLIEVENIIKSTY